LPRIHYRYSSIRYALEIQPAQDQQTKSVAIEAVVNIKQVGALALGLLATGSLYAQTISKVTVNTAATPQTMTITGSGFASTNTVKLSGTTLTKTSTTTTSIVAALPSPMTAGDYLLQIVGKTTVHWYFTYGAVGPQGPAGVPGSNGEAGAPGPAGPAGPQGIPGPMGLTGATGPAGPRGEQGAQGQSGPQGASGSTGPQGDQGPLGAFRLVDSTGREVGHVVDIEGYGAARVLVTSESGAAIVTFKQGDAYTGNQFSDLLLYLYYTSPDCTGVPYARKGDIPAWVPIGLAYDIPHPPLPPADAESISQKPRIVIAGQELELPLKSMLTAHASICVPYAASPGPDTKAVSLITVLDFAAEGFQPPYRIVR
jgi:Collagen triple helix repeat (20 copies)